MDFFLRSNDLKPDGRMFYRAAINDDAFLI